jgi:hypothetical protein
VNDSAPRRAEKQLPSGANLSIEGRIIHSVTLLRKHGVQLWYRTADDWLELTEGDIHQLLNNPGSLRPRKGGRS